MGWALWTGIAVVGLLLGDVFFTVLHPQAHGGPINRFLMRTIWGWFRAIGGMLKGDARRRFLSLGAPVLSAAVLFTWAAFLVAGFALIYASNFPALTHTQWVSTIGWAEAFYFSGIAATTLGMGDVLVEPGWFRALAVLEGFLGFLLISISAAYILAIYGSQGQVSSFSIEVWGTVGEDEEAGIRRLAADLDSTEDWADATGRSLAKITGDLSQYPILHYFRPQDDRHSLVPQIGVLMRLFQRIDERPGWEHGHPSLVMLRNTVGRYLEEVSRRFARKTGIDVDEDDDELWLERYRQARRHLAYD